MFNVNGLQITKTESAKSSLRQTANENQVKNTNKINKKKLAVSIAASIGICALAAGGLLYKQKISSNATNKLAEKIDFVNCETLQEAIEFANKNLGIKKYSGFSDADLDVVNWINESLVNINNTCKGKASMPKRILYKSIENEKNGDYVGATMDSLGTLRISKGFVEYVKRINEKHFNNGHKFTSTELKAYIEQKFGKNFSGYLNAYNYLCKSYNLSNYNVSDSPFYIINHEMGHFQHCVNTKKTLPCLDSKFESLFNNSEDIVSSVSQYAKASPTEFVAECFSVLMDNNKNSLSKEVLDLYLKLGGPIF